MFRNGLIKMKQSEKQTWSSSVALLLWTRNSAIIGKNFRRDVILRTFGLAKRNESRCVALFQHWPSIGCMSFLQENAEKLENRNIEVFLLTCLEKPNFLLSDGFLTVCICFIPSIPWLLISPVRESISQYVVSVLCYIFLFSSRQTARKPDKYGPMLGEFFPNIPAGSTIFTSRWTH